MIQWSFDDFVAATKRRNFVCMGGRLVRLGGMEAASRRIVERLHRRLDRPARGHQPAVLRQNVQMTLVGGDGHLEQGDFVMYNGRTADGGEEPDPAEVLGFEIKNGCIAGFATLFNVA